MDSFTSEDRERLIDVDSRVGALERSQRISLRRLRRLPDHTATAIVKAVSRRVLIWVGIGIVLGSLLGGSGIELVRAMIPTILKAVH